jgi:hypothetical protein
MLRGSGRRGIRRKTRVRGGRRRRRKEEEEEGRE